MQMLLLKVIFLLISLEFFQVFFKILIKISVIMYVWKFFRVLFISGTIYNYCSSWLAKSRQNYNFHLSIATLPFLFLTIQTFVGFSLVSFKLIKTMLIPLAKYCWISWITEVIAKYLSLGSHYRFKILMIVL